ncbi:MAG: hypothetical protein AMXMBFR55_13650 [Gemmatimonadota bacterium]
MRVSPARRRFLVLIVGYLAIQLAALWFAQGDATATPSFIYQAF